MRSLFVKIFLWFWAATTLVVFIFTVITWRVLPRQPEPPWRKDIVEMVSVYADSAVDAYTRGGKHALAEYLARREAQTGTAAFLFDANLTELAGREPAPQVMAAVSEAVAPTDAFVLSHPYVLARCTTFGPGGEPLIFVVAFRPAFDGRTIVLWPQIAAALLTAGLVCYALARYLTSPLGKLQEAARNIAGGDLSARVEARALARGDELGELARGFNRMAERLEAIMTAERRLLSDISHELRSPLARLGVALGLARMHAGEGAQGSLDRIGTEAERLEELIGELLTLARLQIGGAKTRERIDLACLVREIVADADFEARAIDRGVVCGEFTACEVEGDSVLLRSAIENVVRNAVRYTPEGADVEVSLSAIRAAGSAFAVVAVRDHGAGVPAADLERIFHPFARVGDARDRDSGGVGLGLAITDKAVRSHGGEVIAVNAPGGGLLVRIELPLIVRVEGARPA